MKLEKYEDKSKKKRKAMLISLGVIVLLGISLILYKTFASFSEEVSFPMMNGKVDYFGNSDIYFAFYKGNEQLDEMPLKDNSDNLVFDYGECDNRAEIEWNSNEWAPLVKNLSKSKTKCSLYFREKASINICNKYGNDSAICYITKLGDSDYENMAYDHVSINGVVDNNLRYIGSNPNNYIDIGDRDGEGKPILWRIIGVMNNITEVSEDENKAETIGSYLKIIRKDSLGLYSYDTSASDINTGNGVNEWSDADIQKVLNNDFLYKEDRGGICYGWRNDTVKTCPDWYSIGINEQARKMIANIKWNTGASSIDNSMKLYEYERSNNIALMCDTSLPECNDQVPRNTTWVGKVGLVYPSDYGYAVGGNIRNECLKRNNLGFYSDNCYKYDWIYSVSPIWTITSYIYAKSNSAGLHINASGGLSSQGMVASENIIPVIYLKNDAKIVENLQTDKEYGSIDNPFVLK